MSLAGRVTKRRARAPSAPVRRPNAARSLPYLNDAVLAAIAKANPYAAARIAAAGSRGRNVAGNLPAKSKEIAVRVGRKWDKKTGEMQLVKALQDAAKILRFSSQFDMSRYDSRTFPARRMGLTQKWARTRYSDDRPIVAYWISPLQTDFYDTYLQIQVALNGQNSIIVYYVDPIPEGGPTWPTYPAGARIATHDTQMPSYSMRLNDPEIRVRDAGLPKVYNDTRRTFHILRTQWAKLCCAAR